MLARKSKRELIEKYQGVFNSPNGKDILDDLCKQFTLLRNRVDSNKGVDVNRLLVMEGERNVLLYIYQMINKDPMAEQPSHAIGE